MGIKLVQCCVNPHTMTSGVSIDSAKSHNLLPHILTIPVGLSDKLHLDLGFAETLHDSRRVDAYKLGDLLGPGWVIGLALLFSALLLEFLPRNRKSSVVKSHHVCNKLTKYSIKLLA